MKLNTPPDFQVSSVSTSSMLAELVIGVWSGRKLDKSASGEVTRMNNAESGVANVHKNLLAGCQELTSLNRFAGRVRSAHYAMTLPWSDSGLRILPATRFFKYQQSMNEMAMEFNRLLEAFMQAYEWEISKVQVRLGTLFNRDEYPSAEALRKKFYISLNYIPLPTSGDWRVDMDNEAKQQLKEQYATYYENQIATALNDLIKRAHTALGRMSERLDYVDRHDKKMFHDSLVTNVLEISDMLAEYNLTNDPDVQAAHDKLHNAIRGVEAQDLRDDDALRAETKRRVDEVIRTLPGLMSL